MTGLPGDVAAVALQPADPGWEARVRALYASHGFLALLGARITDLGPGRCELTLEGRPDLCQHDGYYHAGVGTTLADTAGGMAAFSLMPAGANVLTTEFNVHLLAPAIGEQLIARATVVKPGRTLTIVSADVLARRGAQLRRVALFHGTMMRLDGERK